MASWTARLPPLLVVGSLLAARRTNLGTSY